MSDAAIEKHLVGFDLLGSGLGWEKDRPHPPEKIGNLLSFSLEPIVDGMTNKNREENCNRG
jgi:hypothetical protein